MSEGGFWAQLGGFIEAYAVPLRILLIVVAAVVAIAVLTALIRKTVARVVTRASERNGVLIRGLPADERAVQRARTAGTLSVNVVVWVIAAVAISLVLGVLGVDLTGILASAGVLAAVLAFGAQNIIKDVLAGLFMVFEDQIGIGDAVDTGTVAGVVEAVGIRVTQVRDVTGTLWFVRNGEISRIGNGSRMWRRVIVDLVLAPETSVEEAREAVLGAMREVAQSPQAAPRVLEEPSSWEIQSFDGGSVALRFVVRTRADAFDELARMFRARVREVVLERGFELVDGREPAWWHAVVARPGDGTDSP